MLNRIYNKEAAEREEEKEVQEEAQAQKEEDPQKTVPGMSEPKEGKGKGKGKKKVVRWIQKRLIQVPVKVKLVRKRVRNIQRNRARPKTRKAEGMMMMNHHQILCQKTIKCQYNFLTTVYWCAVYF